MAVPAVNSAFDIANWFFKKSDSEGIYLEQEKLQHLLFLSQLHYALLHEQEYLFPSLFVCDANGFNEPTLQKALSFGRPLMEAPEFSPEIDHFLTLVWKKYSPMSIKALADFIKDSKSYSLYYRTGKKTIVNIHDIVPTFKNSLNASAFNKNKGLSPKKVLISQNGPVVVSQWSPRKLPHSSTKHLKQE